VHTVPSEVAVDTVSPRLRVLFIVTAYPRHDGDVITPWLSEAISRLAEHAVDVEVLAPSYRGCGDQIIGGVRVHRFRYAPRRFEQLTHDQTAPDRIRERPVYAGLVPSYAVAGALKAMQLARSGRFDVVHAFWPMPHGLFGLAARAATGIPLVCTFFGVELAWIGKDLPFLAPVLRWVARSSNAVTTNSQHTAQLLERHTGRDVVHHVIPFGVAMDTMASIPSYRADPKRPFEMLFIGRLVERKGVRHLIDAVARLPRDRRTQLHVIGDGPERTRLEQSVRALGLADRVTFHGFVSPAQKLSRLGACDVLVLPAVVDAKGDTEGQGVVLLEAMAFAKPVVASRLGGIVEAVEDGVTGLLVPPGDPAALAAALCACMDDRARAQAMGAAGRARVQAHFSWDAITRDLVELYRGVRADR
jgi:glycosyltransferase involved in cell wall biosynthesis